MDDPFDNGTSLSTFFARCSYDAEKGVLTPAFRDFFLPLLEVADLQDITDVIGHLLRQFLYSSEQESHPTVSHIPGTHFLYFATRVYNLHATALSLSLHPDVLDLLKRRLDINITGWATDEYPSWSLSLSDVLPSGVYPPPEPHRGVVDFILSSDLGNAAQLYANRLSKLDRGMALWMPGLSDTPEIEDVGFIHMGK